MSTKCLFNSLLLISCLLPLALVAQVEKTGRYEVTLPDDSPNAYHVVSAGDQGIILCRQIAGTEGRLLEVTRLDTLMHESWKGAIPLEEDLRLLRSSVRAGMLFLLFRSGQNSVGNFLIVTMKVANGSYGSYIIKNIIPFIPSQFVITSDAALIGGYFNYRPLVLHFNFSANQSKILPGFFNEPGQLDQVRANSDGSVDIIVSGRNFERKNCLWIRTYDRTGSLIKTVVLTPDEKKQLLFGSSMNTDGDNQVVVGIYGRNAEYSRGFFVSNVNPYGEYDIKYYTFSELDNFFNYMSVPRQKRIKARIERKKLKGRNAKFSYRLLVHEIVPFQNQFLLIGEAFFPHYTYTNSRGMIGGRALPGYRMPIPTMTNDYMVFDGYQYTHAVVIAFNKEGKIAWNNSFPINEVKSMELEKFVKVKAAKDRIVLLYLFNNVLRSKIIENAEVKDGESPPAPSKRKRPGSLVPQATARLDYWYDKCFYAFGQERIPAGADGKNARNVFFINKITYK